MSTRGHHGLLLGTAGGGSAGAPPNTYAGLTFWYDGDNSAHFSGIDSSSGSPGASDDFQRFDSAAAISRVLVVGAGTARLKRLSPVVGSSAGFRTGSASGGSFYAKPSAGAGPSVPATLGNLFSASNKAVVCAIKVRSAPSAAGADYNNPLIIGDASVYTGLHVYSSGGKAVFVGLNYDGNYDKVTKIGPELGGWAVVTMRHSAGQLRIRVNGGAWTSVASGNTASTADPMTMFYYSTSFLDAEIAQFCTYNASRSDAELLEVERYLGAKVGITI